MKRLSLILVILLAVVLSACQPSAEERLLQADEAVSKGNYVEAAHIISEMTPREVRQLNDAQQQKLQELILIIELSNKEAMKILEQQ